MKILFLLDFPKHDHYITDEQGFPKEIEGEYKWSYFRSDAGAKLKGAVEHENLLNLGEDDWGISYVYKQFPEYSYQGSGNNRRKTYKRLKVSQEKMFHSELDEQITREQPEVVVPMGNAGAQYLLGKKALTKQRGVPVRKEIVSEDTGLDHSFWVFPMFSFEYMMANPNSQNLIESDLLTLEKYLEHGDSAFEPEEVTYKFHTEIESVRKLFKEEIPNARMTAWDLETNTLRPDLPGAKAIVMTVSTQEGSGHTIPLEHRSFQWEKEELDEIYQMITDFVQDKNIPKVGHNLQFDAKFLQLTKGIDNFQNHADTKILYYLLINQEVEGSLKLSDLSYELTEIGGYDKGLEEWKSSFISEKKAEASEKKKEEKKRINEVHKIAKKEAKDAGRPVPEKEEVPEIEPPKNEVDGSDFNYEWFPLKDVLHPYAAGDVDACLRIYNRLEQKGYNLPHIWRLGHEFYTGLTATLAEMEANGVKIDRKYNVELSEAYDKRAQELFTQIRQHPLVQELEDEHRQLYELGLEEWAKPKAERDEVKAKLRDRYKTKLEFNPTSPVDKQKLFFKDTPYRPPVDRETLTDSAQEEDVTEATAEWHHFKTNVHVLELLQAEHEEIADLCALMIEYSAVTKKKSNYTHKLREACDENMIAHPNFNASGTVTSRLSSSNFNAQNLPSKTSNPDKFDYKYPIKRMFISRFEDGVLLQADYSSLEMRLLALACGDEKMTKAFMEGLDVHKETAAMIHGVSEDEVDDEMRQGAKAINFGLVYGESPFSFAPKQNITVEEAEDIFERYYSNKPRVKEFIDDTHEQVKRKRYVETLAGFRRNLNNVRSNEKQKRNKALRESVNTIIQGTGAYLTNLSLIKINAFLKSKGLRSKLILTVHDSIVVDCPPEEVTVVARAVKYIMENLPVDWLFIDWEGEKVRFPIGADVEVGKNYNDMVDYDEEDYKSFSTAKGYCKFYQDLKHLKNLKNNGDIEEEKYEKLTHTMKETKKSTYRQIA